MAPKSINPPPPGLIQLWAWFKSSLTISKIESVVYIKIKTFGLPGGMARSTTKKVEEPYRDKFHVLHPEDSFLSTAVVRQKS